MKDSSKSKKATESEMHVNDEVKIKDIIIELNDFSFFHQSSSLDQQDDRVIGREKEFQNLKNVISNTATNSGTYLVTGFRGIGKTSLVNNVLRELKGAPRGFSLKRYARVLLFAMLDISV